MILNALFGIFATKVNIVHPVTGERCIARTFDKVTGTTSDGLIIKIADCDPIYP